MIRVPFWKNYFHFCFGSAKKLFINLPFQLSRSEDKANNASQILDKLMNSLLIEHVDYALELGLQSVPVVEGSRSPPTIYFFTVLHHANNIIHLVEKQFSDVVLPLIR